MGDHGGVVIRFFRVSVVFIVGVAVALFAGRALPDRGFIVYADDGLWLLDMRTRMQVFLGSEGFPQFGLSADGTRIAYTDGYENDIWLFAMTLPDREAQPLTATATIYSRIAWAGDQIFYSTLWDGEAIQVYTYDTTTGEIARFRETPFNELSAVPSPDGEQVLIVSTRHVVNDSSLLVTDGDNERFIFGPEVYSPAAVWAPGGEAIVALVAHPDGQDLFWVEMGSGAWRQLTHTPEPESSPSFSPDGRSLAFEIPQGKLFTLDLASGSMRQFSDGGVHNPVWGSATGW